MRLRASTLYIVAGILLFSGIALEISHIELPDRIDAFLQTQVKKAIVWQPDAPEPTKGETMSLLRRFLQTFIAQFSTTARYESDLHPGDPVDRLHFWLFNITNLAEVQSGEKPFLEEVGPFTYIVHRKKIDVEFSPDGDTVKFREYLYFLEDLDPNGPPLTAPVTTLNLPLVGALAHLKALPAGPAGRWLEMLASWIEGWRDPRVDGLFTTRTAGELLWGYEDPLLAKLSNFVRGLDPRMALAKNMSSPDDAADFNVVKTGKSDIRDIWDYQVWHGIDQVSSWNPPHIERVHGSDALQFPPGIKQDQEQWVWVGEAFRAAKLKPMLLPGEKLPFKLAGLEVIRYRPDLSLREPDPRYFQFVSGLMNVTSPMAGGALGKANQPGVPLFMSLPHFCFVDEAVASGVEGLECDFSKHDLFLDVEPTTGVTLRAKKSLMLSSQFSGEFAGKIDKHLRNTVLPMFWAQEGTQAAKAQLMGLQPLRFANAAAHFLRSDLARWVAIVLSVLGIACVVGAAWVPAPQAAGVDDGDDLEEATEPLIGNQVEDAEEIRSVGV